MAGDIKEKPQKDSDDIIDWFTVSYRSIYITIGLVVAVAGWYFGLWQRLVPKPSPSPTLEASPTSASSSARFNDMQGSVQVKKAGRLEWVSATSEMVLNQGDLVRTGSGAAAEISFANGTTFHMRPESLMTIFEATEDPGSKRPRVNAALQSGTVNFQTGAAGTTISTPVSKTTAGSEAEGNIAVSDSGESRIGIYRGAATTKTNIGETVELTPNEGLTVDAGGKAGTKVVLPPVPVLEAPPHQAEITYVNPAVSTTLLAWKAVATAQTYHVVVDYTASFARPLVDQKGWKPSSMQLRGLEVGKYYWKVAAVDAGGVEGSFSEFARFSVTTPAPGTGQAAAPPTLVLDVVEPAGNILHVKGHTQAGASLTVNGQRVDVQTDGSFNEWISLDKPGKQTVVIRATDVNGGVNEQKRPVVVTY